LGFLLRTHEKGEEKKHIIAFPFPESPAYRAGLRSGDQIVQADGTSVTEKTRDEVLELLKQRRNAGLRLSILPFGQTESKEISVRAEKYHYGSVIGGYVDAEQQVFGLEAHPRTGYIWITSFTGTTAKEFGGTLEQMTQSGVESFILDLRDNPGGDVWNCVQVVKMLIPPGAHRNIIVTSRNRNGRERSFTLVEGEQRTTLPMVVLINGDTASSSEIIAAALQDHKRATVVGTRSFGKGIIQGIFDLPFQSGMMQLTDAEYRRPNGAAIHRRVNAADTDDWGVIPDKAVELTEAEQSAAMPYRLLRSRVISPERSAVLDILRQQIIDEQSEEDGKPFEFTGAAPYYDLQLDEAVKLLQ
jgi:carboxyl-terminal processing protease